MFLALDVTLAGAAAFLLAVSGIITSIMAMRKARQEGEENCREQLKMSREEAEKYAQELHKIRLEHPELMPPKEEGRSTLWLIVSIGLFIVATVLATRIFIEVKDSPEHPLREPTTETTTIVVPGTGTNTGN